MNNERGVLESARALTLRRMHKCREFKRSGTAVALRRTSHFWRAFNNNNLLINFNTKKLDHKNTSRPQHQVSSGLNDCNNFRFQCVKQHCSSFLVLFVFKNNAFLGVNV
jgi:hypothetical protein